MAVQLELLVEPATVVTTAAELKAAVASGDPHIEIRRHLDLRYSARGNPTPGGLDVPVPAGQSLPASSRRLQDAAPKPPVLGTVANTLRAIRVRTLPLVPMHVLLQCKRPCRVRGPIHRAADDGIWLHWGCTCAFPYKHPCEAKYRGHMGLTRAGPVPRRSPPCMEHACTPPPDRTTPVSAHWM